jgi:hypothetical protein
MINGAEKTLHFLDQRSILATTPAYNLPCLSSEVGCKGNQIILIN